MVVMLLACHYDGDDRSLTVELNDEGPGDMSPSVPHDYTDDGGWRCFRDREGRVMSMRFDLASPTTDLTLVGSLLGPAAMGLARRVLDEARTTPAGFVSHSKTV